MPKGTIMWFNYQKGYGFIKNDDGDNVFVHYSAFKDDDYYHLHEGQRVDFEVKQGQKNTFAASVNTIR